jgi:hypothetical protein
MTQSLIVFAALQIASLAILLAFTALECLRPGSAGVHGKLPAKAGLRLNRASSGKQRPGRNRSRMLAALHNKATAGRGRAGFQPSHKRFFDTARGLNADADERGAKPWALRAT